MCSTKAPKNKKAKRPAAPPPEPPPVATELEPGETLKKRQAAFGNPSSLLKSLKIPLKT